MSEMFDMAKLEQSFASLGFSELHVRRPATSMRAAQERALRSATAGLSPPARESASRGRQPNQRAAGHW